MTKEREEMDFDVLIVGGGPAGLSCAIRLMNLIHEYNNKISTGKIEGKQINIEDKIALIDKGAYFGAHGFSGAIMNPTGIEELIPDFLDKNFPYESKVIEEKVFWLSNKKSYRFPFLPTFLKNKGHYIVSLSKVTAWMAEIAENLGVVMLSGFSGTGVMIEDDKVIGIQTGDKGHKNNREPEEPGYNLYSKVTVLAEGPKGTLAHKVIEGFHLDEGKEIPSYELGCKEIWELPEGRVKTGKVIHTLGYPLDKSKPGGGFIYHLSDNRLALGMVNYLSSEDPYLDPHRELQNWKQHPYLESLLEGGKALYYGAKAIPSGGYYSIPKLSTNGAVILGDSANLLNSQKLKGIHIAIKSGILSAKAIFESLKTNDFSDEKLSGYEKQFYQSSELKELYKVRNFSKVMKKGISFSTIFHIGIQMLFNSADPFIQPGSKADHQMTKKVKDFYNTETHTPEPIKSEQNLILDKLSDVYLSNTSHNEQQPSHITIKDSSICIKECYPNYKSPCTFYCPANVYEISENEKKRFLKVNFANCIHCKAADMKCPFDNIIWEPPEGGDGPKYSML